MGYSLHICVVQQPGDTDMKREGGRGGGWKVMAFVLQGQPGEMGKPGEKVSCGVGISSWSRTALPAKWPKFGIRDCHRKFQACSLLHVLLRSSVGFLSGLLALPQSCGHCPRPLEKRDGGWRGQLLHAAVGYEHKCQPLLLLSIALRWYFT